jgi:hypothetical protein
MKVLSDLIAVNGVITVRAILSASISDAQSFQEQLRSKCHARYVHDS